MTPQFSTSARVLYGVTAAISIVFLAAAFGLASSVWREQGQTDLPPSFTSTTPEPTVVEPSAPASNQVPSPEISPSPIIIRDIVVAEAIENDQPIGATNYFGIAPVSVVLFVRYINARVGDKAAATLWNGDAQINRCNDYTLNLDQGYYACTIKATLMPGTYNFQLEINGEAKSYAYFTVGSANVPINEEQNEPSDLVRCILPTGEQATMTLSECRERLGVLASGH